MRGRQTDAIWNTCVNKSRGGREENGWLLSWHLAKGDGPGAMHATDDYYRSRNEDTCVHATPINNESRFFSPSCVSLIFPFLPLLFSAFPLFSRFYPDGRPLSIPNSEIALTIFRTLRYTRLYGKLRGCRASFSRPHLLRDELTASLTSR